MNRSSRFFRQVWRINAILILVAAAAAAFGICAFVWSEIQSNMRSRSADAAAPTVPGKQPSRELTLGNFSPVDGTTLYRASLSTASRGVSSLSSGDYSSNVRNILVLDGATATAHWLLPSDKEVVAYNMDISSAEKKNGHIVPPVATVTLVKALSPNPEAEEGRILVSDLAATNVREVASGVRQVHGTSLTGSGQIALLFEQRRQFHIALVDPGTRLMLSDRVVAVPALK